MKCLISNQHFTALLISSVISQLSILASHTTNFGSVAQGVFELNVLQFGGCPIF